MPARSRTLPLSLLAATAATLACGGGSDAAGPDDGTPGGGTKTLTATAAGTAWTATVRNGAYLQGSLTIAGHDGNGRNLNISATGLSGAGTYTLGPNATPLVIATWIDGTGQYSSASTGGSGTLTLTTATLGRVAGTFSVVVASPAGGTVRTISIANGSFDLSNP